LIQALLLLLGLAAIGSIGLSCYLFWRVDRLRVTLGFTEMKLEQMTSAYEAERRWRRATETYETVGAIACPPSPGARATTEP
jgi:hypothetical protein